MVDRTDVPTELLSPGSSRVAPAVPREQLRITPECRCRRRHRHAATFARCAWPGAVVSGSGQLALVIRCEPVRVVLVERLSWAHILRAEYSVFGCGATCIGEHELLEIDLDPERAA